MKTNNMKQLNKVVLKNAKYEIVIRIVAQILLRSSIMILPVLYSIIVDKVTNNEMYSAISFIVAAIGVTLLERGSETFGTYTWHKMYDKMYDYYTDVGVKKTLNNSLFSLSRIAMGEYMNVMHTDINLICAFYCDLIRRIIIFIQVAFVLIYFYVINIYVGLAGTICTLLIFMIILISKKKMESSNKIKSICFDKRNSLLSELLTCVREIKSSNLNSIVTKRIDEASVKYTSSFLKQRVLEDAFKFLTLFLVDLFKWGIFIFGIFLILDGKMTLGTILVIYGYFEELVVGFSEISLLNNGLRQKKVSELRFNKLLEYSNDPNYSEEYSNIKIDGDITFENVLYGYKDLPTLNKLSVKFKKNKITCLVGESGSGRSGLFELLLKLNRQHEGTIKIDNLDINNFPVDDYFHLISATGKEAIFFNISIEENLKMTSDNFKEVIKICKDLGIHETITKLSYGYDTVLDSNRNNLDPEVKTLLMFAKTLSKKSKIYLIDETFSSLNNSNDQLVFNKLVELKNNSTILIITNEEHILKQADHVVYMENGEIIAEGKHTDIIKNKNYQNIIKQKM